MKTVDPGFCAELIFASMQRLGRLELIGIGDFSESGSITAVGVLSNNRFVNLPLTLLPFWFPPQSF